MIIIPREALRPQSGHTAGCVIETTGIPSLQVSHSDVVGVDGSVITDSRDTRAGGTGDASNCNASECKLATPFFGSSTRRAAVTDSFGIA